MVLVPLISAPQFLVFYSGMIFQPQFCSLLVGVIFVITYLVGISIAKKVWWYGHLSSSLIEKFTLLNHSVRKFNFQFVRTCQKRFEKLFMKIVVVGLGFVGLSNAVLLAQHNEVIGVDVSKDRVDTLNSKNHQFLILYCQNIY